MKIITNKKAFTPFTEAISVPRDTEDPVVTIAAKDGEISATISHPQFTLSFPVAVESIENEGKASWSFSSFKKAVANTKAKAQIILMKDRVIQEEETFFQEAKPYPALSGSILPNVELKANTLAPYFAPLNLFPLKDPLRAWRNQVLFDKRSDGLHFSQCNGVHLSTLFVGGDFSACTNQTGVLTPFAVSLLERILPLFSSSLLEEADDAIGFLDVKERKELLVKFQPATNVPRISQPALAPACQFHLNPIGKKPFEKVLMERLREYRDEHNLEYHDIRLRFEVAPGDAGEYTVVAQLSHSGSQWKSVLETTSPFLHGAPPAACLPAYDTVKALESIDFLTAFKLTKRGACLESADFTDGVRHVTVFLHGIAA